MNKKLGIIIGVVLVLVAVIAAVFMLKGNKEKPNVDNSQNTVADNNEMANELSPIIGKDSEEVKDILDKPLTDEESQKMDEIIDIISVPNDITEVEINENGDMTYTTADGTIVEEQFRQDIVDKSDEEIEEDFDKIMEELQAQIKGNGNTTNSKPNSDYTTVTEEADIDTGTGMESSNDRQALEEAMKKANEEMKKQGYEGTDASERVDMNDPQEWSDFTQSIVDQLNP